MLTEEGEEHCERDDVPLRLEELLGRQSGNHIIKVGLQIIHHFTGLHLSVYSQPQTYTRTHAHRHTKVNEGGMLNIVYS